MVGICEECAKEYDVVINCKKTVGIQFGNRCNNCAVAVKKANQMAGQNQNQNQNQNRFIRSYYRPRRPLLRQYLVAVAEATWKKYT